MHIIVTSVNSVLILLAIAFGSTAFGKRFRLYSSATILVLVLTGGLTATQASRVEANLPTPWAGLTERISIGGYLLWQVALAIALLRTRASGRFRGRPSCSSSRWLLAASRLCSLWTLAVRLRLVRWSATYEEVQRPSPAAAKTSPLLRWTTTKSADWQCCSSTWLSGKGMPSGGSKRLPACPRTSSSVVVSRHF
jgi:hypothetical protein